MSGQELFHFIRPLWLAALPLAVLLPWWWRRSRQPSGDWERICDPHLLRWLSHHDGSDARVRSGHWLAGLALAIAALALAGPSWHKLPDSSFSALDARVIVLDLSASMLATDLRPNRLTRARFRLADLLNETQEGQTGLVAFAGDAYAVSPLTTDTNTIANMLPALQPDVIPVRGSRADRGLGMAATLLERAGFTRGEVLLVTDSATARDAARARELRDRGIITSVLAVGTVDGSPIPSGSGFLTDRGGNVIITSLDMASLQAVSQAGGGKFSELETVTAGLEPWAAGEGSEFTRREDALGQRWQDSGPWLVLLLLPLALIGFRRGVLFLLPLGLLPALLHVPEAQAGWWADAWQRRDQQAWQALKTEDNERAAALANDPDISGEAWYRSGKYDSALAAWAKRQTADAEYNKGNTLAQLGDYAGALNAYERALEMEPGMEDARFNRELVEQLQQQQEQQQKDQEGDSQAGESQEGESSDLASQGDTSEQADGQSPDEGEPGEQQEGEQESEQGEGEQGGKHGNQTNYAESWSAEDAQAMEQWLRRIPDDPGGLLRRKFINEHQRRGAPKDEPEPW